MGHPQVVLIGRRVRVVLTCAGEFSILSARSLQSEQYDYFFQPSELNSHTICNPLIASAFDA